MSRLVLALGLLGSTAASAQLGPGWHTVQLDEQSTHFDAYVPAGLDPAVKAPVIVFLHRAGSDLVSYRTALQPAADATGAILALPRSISELGWGFPGDAEVVGAAVDRLRELVKVNDSRIGISGHGDGASFALERALVLDAPFSAVFAIGASFDFLPAQQELEYLPPVRLYYGEDDPGSETTLGSLQSQLELRGITVEVEVLAGQDADDLPADAIQTGFQFLVSNSRGGLISDFGCEETDEAICLTGGRFRVTVDWEATDGSSGKGKVAELRSDGSGLFWFFSPKNWELLVKVLRACDINDRFWVYSAASTTLEYTLTVEDLAAQTSVSYTNPQGQAAPAVTDTDALDTCDFPKDPEEQGATAE